MTSYGKYGTKKTSFEESIRQKVQEEKRKRAKQLAAVRRKRR